MLTNGQAVHVVLPDFQRPGNMSSHVSLKRSWLGLARQSAPGRSRHDSYFSKVERSPSSLPLLLLLLLLLPKGIRLAPDRCLRLLITSLVSSSRVPGCGCSGGREVLGLAEEREGGSQTTGLEGLRLDNGRLFMANCCGKHSKRGILYGLVVSIQSCSVGK